MKTSVSDKILSFLIGALVVIIFWFVFESKCVVIKDQELFELEKRNK